MIGLLQRVSQAAVTVNGKTTGTIGRGALVFVGVECGDDEAKADRLLERLLGYRVFPDTEGKMNRSVQDIAGGLFAWCRNSRSRPTPKGMRASFTPAAPPQGGTVIWLSARAGVAATCPGGKRDLRR